MLTRNINDFWRQKLLRRRSEKSSLKKKKLKSNKKKNKLKLFIVTLSKLRKVPK